MYISCNIWDRTYTKNNYLLLIWNSSSCLFLATLPWQPDSANLQREGGLWVEGDGGRSRADRLSSAPLFPRLSLAGPHQAELLFLPQSTFEQSQRLSACSQPVCVSQKQSRHLLQDEEVVQTARVDRKPLLPQRGNWSQEAELGEAGPGPNPCGPHPLPSVARRGEGEGSRNWRLTEKPCQRHDFACDLVWTPGSHVPQPCSAAGTVGSSCQSSPTPPPEQAR